jgi:lipopolysaccharide/colanic/teichoic acid biosynthesis glycosyltransferase
MMLQENPQIELKIAPPESAFIIGSQSINTSGEILSINTINTFLKEESRNSKRIFDILSSLIILVGSPLLILINKNKASFIGNIFKVLFGLKTWVGFAPVKEHKSIIKTIKPAVLNIGLPYKNQNKQRDFFETLNLSYAKKYDFSHDLSIIWQEKNNLGT